MASPSKMFWLLLSFVFGLSVAQSEQATPTATSSWQPTSAARQISMVVGTDLRVALNPLINAAWSDLPHKGDTVMVWAGNLTLVDPADHSALQENITIAYLSCDPGPYEESLISQSDLVTEAVSANISGIVFYSFQDNFCAWNKSIDIGNFSYIYTMTSTSDSHKVYKNLTDAPDRVLFGQILTQLSYDNNENQSGQFSQGQSTKVAMIILYSITGVITALFLIIIITGAVRAHRHPERYGPRHIGGATRQSRARGIARAMLDTIPVVKFGEKPADKAEDVEGTAMQDVPAQAQGEEIASGSTAAQREQPEGETTDSIIAHESRTAGEESSHQGSGPAAETDNGLGCSICTEDFEKGQDIRVLPCDHKFHPACVDPWLLDVSGTCPLCRVDLRPQGDAERNPNGTPVDPNAPLPPPLDPNGATSHETPPSWRRRDVLMRILFHQPHMRHLDQEERIAALRRLAEERRNGEAGHRAEAGQSTEGVTTASGTTPDEEEQRDRRRWSRVRSVLLRR